MESLVLHSAKARLYDSENRVCGYALTNSFGRGVNVALAYDGSYLTNTVYALPNGSRFAVNLTRKASRKELVTLRDYSYGAQSAYWYSTDYDLVGRPTNATDSVSLMREWLYNNRSELAAASVGTNLYGYSYDTIGNRLWSADNIITNSYSANSLNQYTTVGRAAPSAPQTSLAYDADGNMTRDGTYSYSYDAENRLRAVTSRSMTNGAIRVLNAYDHRNRRIRMTVQRLSLSIAQPPALPVEIREWLTLETHTFVWDDNNIVLEDVEFADGTIRTIENFWGLDKSGTLQGAGGVGGLLYIVVDGSIYIPCCDHNGNITRYLDANGNTVAQYTYDAFGGTLSQSGILAGTFHFRFSTKYCDRESGLYYYGYRFYHPISMQWLTRDLIEEAGGINLYAFCENNSVSRHDFNGQSWLTCFGDCVEEWRLDWSDLLKYSNLPSSFNTMTPKTSGEQLWIKEGNSKFTTPISRAILRGQELALKLPHGRIRSGLIGSLRNLRHFMRNPALVGGGTIMAPLTVFEGFYDIGVMIYCSMHCCGGDK